MRRSPDFLALGPSPIRLTMTILRCDARNQFRQVVFPASRAQDDGAIGIQGERHAVSFAQTGLFGDRLGNKHGEAVSPFRNSCVIWHWIYFEYTSTRSLPTPSESRSEE